LDRFTGVLEYWPCLLAAWLGSTDRRHIRWRTVAWGLGLQLIFAFLVLRFEYGERALAWAGDVVKNMPRLHLRRNFGAVRVAGHANSSLGSIFRRSQVLPTIIFISAFFAVLYHIGVMQIVIRGLAWVHAQDHAHLRRREHERGGLHLHGPDRSAADHSALPGRRQRAAN